MSLAYRSLENGLSDDSMFGHVGCVRLLCGFGGERGKVNSASLLELMYGAGGQR